MEIIETQIDNLVMLQPTIYTDERGYFFESYNQKLFDEYLGEIRFVQDNESKSKYGVLRGLHFQVAPMEQSKLVRVTSGEVLDVAVDLRPDSATFGQWLSVVLSAENKTQLFIPKGFAHGFVTLSEEATFNYKCDEFYSGTNEKGIHFGDPTLNIEWGLQDEQIIISAKDARLPHFNPRHFGRK